MTLTYASDEAGWTGRASDELGWPLMGLKSPPGRIRNKENRKILLYGITLGYCPLWSRCPKEKQIPYKYRGSIANCIGF